MSTQLSKKQQLAKANSSKWNQERRLEFIDYRLCWCGHINRGDLVNFFGISVPQSSLDLSKYIELAPNNLKYSRSTKVYERTPKFKPLFNICEPENYLNDVLLNAQGTINPNFNYLEAYPAVACFCPPKRKVSYDILSTIVYCIQNRRMLQITYQSNSNPEPHKRLISPHALAFNGIRWHVRAYSHDHNEFRDFVLSRIISTGKMEKSVIDPNEDMKWNFIVSLRIVPNENLSESQRKAIELEYGMEDGEVVYKCRQALLDYTLDLLGLSPDHDKLADLDPQPGIHRANDLIALKNKKEVFFLLSM